MWLTSEQKLFALIVYNILFDILYWWLYQKSVFLKSLPSLKGLNFINVPKEPLFVLYCMSFWKTINRDVNGKPNYIVTKLVRRYFGIHILFRHIYLLKLAYSVGAQTFPFCVFILFGCISALLIRFLFCLDITWEICAPVYLYANCLTIMLACLALLTWKLWKYILI